jgi:hypothetical protein
LNVDGGIPLRFARAYFLFNNEWMGLGHPYRDLARHLISVVERSLRPSDEQIFHNP